MSWPVKDADRATLGKTILKEAKGLVAGADVQYGELTLTAPAGKIVEALTYLRDAPRWDFASTPALRERVARIEKLPALQRYYVPFNAPVPDAPTAAGAAA